MIWSLWCSWHKFLSKHLSHVYLHVSFEKGCYIILSLPLQWKTSWVGWWTASVSTFPFFLCLNEYELFHGKIFHWKIQLNYQWLGYCQLLYLSVKFLYLFHFPLINHLSLFFLSHTFCIWYVTDWNTCADLQWQRSRILTFQVNDSHESRWLPTDHYYIAIFRQHCNVNEIFSFVSKMKVTTSFLWSFSKIYFHGTLVAMDMCLFRVSSEVLLFFCRGTFIQ